MTYQITIVGLGETGTSLGLALKYQKDSLKRVGCDLLKYAEKNAQDADAVDEIRHNLFDALKDADIIFLAIPSDEVQKTMELIGQDLREETALLECCPNKSAALAWSKQYLKYPANYAGIWPALNAARLGEAHDGIHSAREDLFQGGTFFITSDVNTDPSVIKLASDLANLVGAVGAFSDPQELDGLIAASYNLPQIISHALFSSVSGQVSWKETRKLTGKSFFQTTAAIASPMDQNDAGTVLMNNRESTIRSLNQFMTLLKEYRDALQDQDENALRLLLESSSKGRETWLLDYKKADWRNEGSSEYDRPSLSESISQMFLGGLGRRKKRE